MSKINFGNKTNLYPVVDEEKQITAENINEIKASVNELYDTSKPLTNQPAPTTATVGYLGQVIYDADGNEWKCIGIDGITYTWEKQLRHLTITQANYDALTTKDANTIYVIVG